MTALDTWMKANDRDDASVARALGTVSRSQINRLRNGRSKPSLETAKALAELTGIPVLSLLEAQASAARVAA